MSDTEDKAVEVEKTEPKRGQAEEPEATKSAVPRLKATIQVASSESDEAVREYAVALMAEAFGRIREGAGIGVPVPDPLPEPWGRYDWDVPSEQQEENVRGCLAELDDDELRLAASATLEIAFNDDFAPATVLFTLLATPDGRTQFDDLVRLERKLGKLPDGTDAATDSEEARSKNIQTAVIRTVSLILVLLAIPFVEVPIFEFVAMCAIAYGFLNLGGVTIDAWVEVLRLGKSEDADDKASRSGVIANAALWTFVTALVLVSLLFSVLTDSAIFKSMVGSAVFFGICVLVVNVVDAWMDVLRAADE